MFLHPRWTQSTNYGWFFAAADETSIVGAVAMRAGKWDWPYDNQIIVEAAPGAGAAKLVYPTWKGRRFSYLIAGPSELTNQAPSLRFAPPRKCDAQMRESVGACWALFCRFRFRSHQPFLNDA